ncbi:hypothetical protein [Candidatus Phytoplasma pruni]|uniref:Uncharacterized protein n=1 Tax=Candidatus Phytoplasma pruni TaxID=479893 RepID=A0A851HK29_9MOLU|nr:hypothetical protein [Candidatus Phytoplasma pruni]NWN45886.1 hypothetical protein [Candidatus Phytoplasma pruni]
MNSPNNQNNPSWHKTTHSYETPLLLNLKIPSTPTIKRKNLAKIISPQDERFQNCQTISSIHDKLKEIFGEQASELEIIDYNTGLYYVYRLFTNTNTYTIQPTSHSQHFKNTAILYIKK